MDATGQLSVITDEIGQDVELILPTLKKYDIKAVELRNVWGKNIISFSDEELDNLIDVLKNNNMGVSNVAGPLFKCWAPWHKMHDATSQSFSRNVHVSRNALGRALEIVKKLGTDRTRVFGYLGSAKVTNQQWEQLVNDITRFVDMAKQEKVTIVIENEAMSPVSTWENALRILQDIDDPYFKLLLDPGNFFFAGEVHDAETYASQIDRVGHHHVKDGKKTLFAKHFTTVGKGVLGYDKYFSLFRQKGYAGYYSLETHVLRNRSKISYECLENMHAMLKK